jgi:hypothetical protein
MTPSLASADEPEGRRFRNANRNEVTVQGGSIRLGRQEPFRERRRMASTRDTKASGD